MRFTARERLTTWAHASRVQTEQETYDMNAKDEPGLGDDIACSKCGAVALDTGLECTVCGHDMRPEIYPEDQHPGVMPRPDPLQ